MSTWYDVCLSLLYDEQLTRHDISARPTLSNWLFAVLYNMMACSVTTAPWQGAVVPRRVLPIEKLRPSSSYTTVVLVCTMF